VLGVLRWAEIRRMREVEGLSIREIARRTGHDRNTVRRALRRAGPPCYERQSRPSKLDPFGAEIHRLLDYDAEMPGKRILELLAGLGYQGSKTILYDYLREIRPHFLEARTYQRTRYRPGELVQFDVWEPAREVPAQGARAVAHRGHADDRAQARPALLPQPAPARPRRAGTRHLSHFTVPSDRFRQAHQSQMTASLPAGSHKCCDTRPPAAVPKRPSPRRLSQTRGSDSGVGSTRAERKPDTPATGRWWSALPSPAIEIKVGLLDR
jgi:transcriptional regulator with XRE-family HTH domain